MKQVLPKQTPSFRLHKASGQAFVELNGRRVYLGRHDRPETRQHYHQVLAEWMSNGKELPIPQDELTVTELIAAYIKHVEEYYRKPDGAATSQQTIIKQGLKTLNNLYGNIRVLDFGPRALRSVRQVWIEQRMCRRSINKYVSNLRRMFKWATSHELIPATVYHSLMTVEGLRAGRSEAQEKEPVKPVPEEHIQAVQPFVSRHVWAAVQLQLFTGARPGEILKLRPLSFDTKEAVWTARLDDHKTAHHGRSRVLCFGPKSQEIVRTLMQDCCIADFLFSPLQAERERYAKCKGHRRPNQKPNPRKTDRCLGHHYRLDSYRKAIHAACIRAGVPPWTPNRLRHNSGTLARREAGLDGAQVHLGHAYADVTQVYAEADLSKAMQIAARIG